ncbi:MAG TPA: type I methionyl aminopeptidase [Nitrospirota bacterium]|nr:type I methionyl aminopeptidase [Nitrospirota bacterium]
MIILKSSQEIEKIRKACIVVADVLERIRDLVRPGTSTQSLDDAAERWIREAGALPAFKGYRGYPRTLCTSVNNEVIHGIPSRDVVLKTGDIVSIDVGAISEGFYGDAAVTLPVGEISSAAARLIKATEESLLRGIEQAREGNRLYDISHAVQRHIEAQGYSIVRDYVGHGIGRNLHEDPQIPNFGSSGQGPRLKAGMVLAIEPMVNAGGSATVAKQDGWTVVTADGSLSAHFEHTIAIMNNGPEILTKKQ